MALTNQTKTFTTLSLQETILTSQDVTAHNQLPPQDLRDLIKDSNSNTSNSSFHLLNNHQPMARITAWLMATVLLSWIGVIETNQFMQTPAPTKGKLLTSSALTKTCRQAVMTETGPTRTLYLSHSSTLSMMRTLEGYPQMSKSIHHKVNNHYRAL